MENKGNHKIINRAKLIVFHHWILLNSFTLVFFLTLISFLFVIQPTICFLVFVGFMPLCFLINDVRFDVAERCPKCFLKFQHVQGILSKFYWRFLYPIVITLFALYFLIPLKFPNYVKEISPFFVPTLIIFIFLFVGSTIYQLLMIGNARQLPLLLKVRAEAYFIVISEILKKPTKNKQNRFVSFLSKYILGKKRKESEDKKTLIRMFENGMNDLNSLMITRFSCELSNLKKYKDYFSYVVWSGEKSEINRMQKVIDILACDLRLKINLQGIVWTTRQILTENISKEGFFQDLDFKTGINRWYSHNKEVLQVVFGSIPIVLGILAFFVHFS
jgi:hypothetical protein